MLSPDALAPFTPYYSITDTLKLRALWLMETFRED
jgi:hypothetical protein